MGQRTEASEAADMAVKRVFYLLGVDVDNARSVEDFRADLRFGSKLRRLADHGAMGMVGVIVIGLMAAVWHGIVQATRVR